MHPLRFIINYKKVVFLRIILFSTIKICPPVCFQIIVFMGEAEVGINVISS